MRKNQYIKIACWSLSLLVAVCITGCNEWTDVESVTIHEPEIADQNPELFAAYLNDLRTYKASEHPITIGWFDNRNKTPLGRADHLSMLPDSIDFVSLMKPDSLSQYLRDEMEQVRNDKGTRFLLGMDFEKIRLIYDTKVAEREAALAALEEEETPHPALPGFVEFLVDSVNQILPLVNRHDYDGIILNYRGKSILHMTNDERLLHTAYEKAFIGIAMDWHQRNPKQLVFFEGYPQNLLDKSILEECAYIIIPCSDAGNESKIDYNILSAQEEGVPRDRFVISVEMPSLDKTDTKTGIWADGVTPAVSGAARRVSVNDEHKKIVGLGIRNVNNDYYHIARIYPLTRDAINSMNPSPKK